MALSKRQRGKAIRGTQYGVLVVVLVIFAFTANWTKLREAFLDGEVAAGMFPEVITVGLLNTLIYTGLGFGFGLVLGLLVALMRLSSVPVYRWLSGLYVEFFRGLPALLVILAIGNGIPLAFGTQIDRYVSIMLALGIVGSAYMAETIRAGIQAVPKGQVEAARSLGMSQTRAMLWIVVPQAFKIILPPLTNELILLTKDSSLVLFLGSSQLQYELTQFGRTELNQSRSLTPVLVAGICYLIITIPLSYLSRYLERRTGGKKIASPTATEVDTEAVK
ncbi:polar amino acid ABC transporter, inner membrane subunit [Actinokineospora spheciospongiae]|uniref:Polar amino acid ABC transporter, inner membrane subunit n=1 Tax=Actinokineospora spheciospongiae TaxID=909613 RepID=W7IWT6_9PSEU|nr:amino acid ABC transporter permease [Actinokineospora spheciospongiae]EWC58489.1 polar amino acid ABC transporter, inner membrane subunit [Actinokineospora spheciospongiae]PWW61836.1 amino acid ABC transporter membrane protein (PAAT family) [Actinokineospora spheciospongiae]